MARECAEKKLTSSMQKDPDTKPVIVAIQDVQQSGMLDAPTGDQDHVIDVDDLIAEEETDDHIIG